MEGVTFGKDNVELLEESVSKGSVEGSVKSASLDEILKPPACDTEDKNWVESEDSAASIL